MQRGQIKRVGKCWLLRYWESVRNESGNVVKRRVARKLATFSDQYRTEASVRPLAEEILAPQNAKTARPESTQTVADFLENVYLPHCAETLRPSTCKSYGQMFGLVKPHLGTITMRDFRTPDAAAVLRAATEEKQRAHTTHCNMKSFLSGAFRWAREQGVIERENPLRDVGIPRGKSAGETYAYTLDEIQAMLAVLGEPARTLVLVAALTGLRISEIKGLRWEDFNGDELRVSRSVWSGRVSETKTLSSHAAVPVLEIVKEALEEHRRGAPDGFIFQARNGNPLRAENTLRRDMLPALGRAGIQWHGWHAFRRGLGSNLYRLGAPDKIIQAILRHANVSTTLQYYVRPVASESVAAMRKLEKAFTKSGTRRAGLASATALLSA
jgi:integrase